MSLTLLDFLCGYATRHDPIMIRFTVRLFMSKDAHLVHARLLFGRALNLTASSVVKSAKSGTEYRHVWKLVARNAHSAGVGNHHSGAGAC